MIFEDKKIFNLEFGIKKKIITFQLQRLSANSVIEINLFRELSRPEIIHDN